jgi:hypothetical protein
MLGASLDAPGDMDSDGVDDLLIGATGNTTAGVGAGGLYLLYGGTALSGRVVLSTQGTLVTGEKAGDEAGSAVSGTGDVNGDGDLDVLVGAPGASGDAGVAYLVLGPVPVAPVRTTLSEAMS